jgi:hypothetical protein
MKTLPRVLLRNELPRNELPHRPMLLNVPITLGPTSGRRRLRQIHQEAFVHAEPTPLGTPDEPLWIIPSSRAERKNRFVLY